MKWYLGILFLPIISLILFIIWMNITPGYFRSDCECNMEIIYTSDKKCNKCWIIPVFRDLNFLEETLKYLSHFDLYR